MTEPTTQDPTGVVPDADSTSATPVPPPSPKSPGLSPDIYADDGKTWKSKYHGIAGRLNVVEKKRDTEIGGRDQQIADAQQIALERDTKITTLEANVAKLTGETETILQLQGALDEANERAKRAGKLEILMQYPTLLTMQVEEEQQVEGQEEPVRVQVNPFMRLIETTTLAGEDLAQELQRLATVLPGTPATAVAPVVEGAAPQPVQPVNTSDVEALRAKALELHAKVVGGDATAKDEERKAWAALYKAQSKE